MKIPGLTKQEIEEVIYKVIDNHKNKSFLYFTSEDIKAQSCVIILEILPRFDPSKVAIKDLKKALEHWLNTVVSNRLANFHRDNYKVKQKLGSAQPHNLMSPKDIDVVPEIVDSNINFEDLYGTEIWEYLTNRIDKYDYDIMAHLLSGEYIPNYYRIKLENKVKTILKEYGQ